MKAINNDSQNNFSSASKETIEVYSIYGIINTGRTNQLVAVTKAGLVGDILGKPVLRALKFRFIALNSIFKESPEDVVGRKMIERWLHTTHFFFSNQYDLTSSLE